MPDQIPLFVHGPVSVDKLPEPDLISRTEERVAVHDVVPDQPLERVGVLVDLDQALLLRLDLFQQLLVDTYCVER